MLKPFLVTESHIDTWPGTQLLGHKAILRRYWLNSESMTLLQNANGLFSWLAPDLPEDLAFYSTENVLWLGTISHEADAWFADTSLSREEIVQNVPGIVLSP